MSNKNMTALVSAFARAYHTKNSQIKIYSDCFADRILSEKEYNDICENMANGIEFFNPDFSGKRDEALEWIVNNQIAPSILARSAFNKRALENAIMLGCEQYLIFGVGYDTSAIGLNINCYEIDKEEMISDKIQRLEKCDVDLSNIEYISCDFRNDNWFSSINNSSYKKELKSFNSFLGVSYYLTSDEFCKTVGIISNNICKGSSILFDFQTNETSVETKRNERLAEGADEKMKSKYSYREIEKILEDNNMLIYEYLDDKKMTKQFFENYNDNNPSNNMTAPKGVAYILAVKQ